MYFETSMRVLLAILISVFAVCDSALSQELEPNGKIALVGNSLAERMNLYGHFETQLHRQFPEHQLRVRNFGFPADAIDIQQRPNNYTKIDDPLKVFSPDTFLCFFGYNESFAGEDGVDQFRANYLDYIDRLQNDFSIGNVKPRIVLISPIAFEATGNRWQPDGVEINQNLSQYTSAIAEVAQARQLKFVDLFAGTQLAFEQQPGAQYTINGCHLNENGDRLLAGMLMRQLIGTEQSPRKKDVTEYERLRAAINDKSWVHLNDYRMLNGWYVYGGRRTYDTETFPQEYKKIRAMVAVRDRRVWDIARGKPVVDTIDDSQTGELIDPPTGLGRHYPRSEPKELKYLSPEESIATMTTLDDLEVQLFASEREFPELANPCQLDFDSRGRLWVACMPNYPQWRPGDARPDDRLLILEDTDSDGRADKSTVFYDRLICPTGFEFYDGGVLVVDEPRILFLKDTDGDDRADVVEQIVDGIATDDTHHTMGAWEWSHGGKLHLLEGVSMSTTLETPWGPFRNLNTPGCYIFDPRSLRWRRFITPGYGNPWCMVFDRWGMGIVGDGTNAQQHWASPLSGADPGSRATTPPIFDNEGMRPAVGSDFLVSRHLPDELQGQFVYACVINMNGIPRFTVEDDQNSAGMVGQRLEDLLTSTDKNFRPVDPKIGPDGALWFGDWCNALIGHMQYSQRDPSRDRRHGRIYRLVHRERDLLPPQTQADRTIRELLDQLTAYELRTRYRARRELWSRDPDQVMDELIDWAFELDDSQPEFFERLCEANWLHESFHLGGLAVAQLTHADDFHFRAAAIHTIGNEHRYMADAFKLLVQALDDPHPRVRVEAVRGLSLIGTTEAARAVLAVVEQPQDFWVDYTLRHAMQAMRPAWQQSHLQGDFATGLTRPQREWFTSYLDSLGPAMAAIEHLQVLASDSDEASRESAIKALTDLRGDADNGREVFYRVCTSCHRVNDRGVEFGPDMTTIHERVEPDQLRQSIIYSIIEPNREIAEEFQTTKILTLDGLLFSGFVESEDGDQIVLRLAGDREIAIAAEDIDQRATEKVSSMPEGLGFSLGPAEFLDVVEFLAQLNDAAKPAETVAGNGSDN